MTRLSTTTKTSTSTKKTATTHTATLASTKSLKTIQNAWVDYIMRSKRAKITSSQLYWRQARMIACGPSLTPTGTKQNQQSKKVSAKMEDQSETWKTNQEMGRRPQHLLSTRQIEQRQQRSHERHDRRLKQPARPTTPITTTTTTQLTRHDQTTGTTKTHDQNEDDDDTLLILSQLIDS